LAWRGLMAADLAMTRRHSAARRQWRCPAMLASAVAVATAVLMLPRRAALVVPRWSRALHEGTHRWQASHVVRPCIYSNAYLIFEEERGKIKKRKYHKRRGKLWKFVNSTWHRVHPDVPPEQLGAETVPSHDAEELAGQIRDSKVVLRLLAFLESALTSPAFNATHVVLALDVLMRQRCTLKGKDLEKLKSLEVLKALAARGQQLLEAGGVGSVPVKAVARALRSLGLYKEDAPQLWPLIKPLSFHAEMTVESMDSTDIACVVWAVAQLKELEPELRDKLLPKLVENDRLHWAQVYLRKPAHKEWAYLKWGLVKLCKDVPFLRQVLNEVTVAACA